MLKAGFGRVDITPPVGCDLQGHFVKITSTGVRDPLLANALYLDDGATQVCIVSCDLAGVTRDAVAQARRLAHQHTGIDPDNVIVCATHTHTGPVIIDFKAMGDRCDPSPQWLDALPDRIATAVVLAKNAAKPTKTCCGNGEEHDVAFVRRYLRKDGTIANIPGPGDESLVRPMCDADPQLGVVAFGDDYDAIQGLLVNYALHLDTVDGTLISADFPGVIRETLTAALGNVGYLYTSGAMGNVNHVKAMAPPRWQNYFECAKRTGTILAGETLRTVARMDAFSDEAPLRVAQTDVTVPLKTFTEEQLAEAKVVAHSDPVDWKRLVPCLGILKASRLGREQFTTSISAIGLGEVGFVTIPGEFYVELGFHIKKHSPFTHTFVIELCGDYIGYIPITPAYEEGGYDCVSSPFEKGAGEILAKAGVELLESIHE